MTRQIMIQKTEQNTRARRVDFDFYDNSFVYKIYISTFY